MIENEIKDKVLDILRKSILKGSKREISLHEPLGELGLGLDSLSMVVFFIELEDTFQVEFPEDLWTDRNQFTLHRFIEHIKKQLSSSKISKRKLKVFEEDYELEKNKFEKVLLAISKKGFWFGIIWSLSYYFHRSKLSYFLEFDLTNKNIPEYNPELMLNFSVASLKDLQQINKVYKNPMSLDEFNRRMNSGYLCFLAGYENEVVAIDWITGNEHFDTIVNLTFTVKKNACYGLDLLERKGFEKKGVGLALLAFSLKESKRRGYGTSIICVDSDNLKMLNASVHIMGYEKTGEFIQTKILSKSFSRWSLNEGPEESKLVIT